MKYGLILIIIYTICLCINIYGQSSKPDLSTEAKAEIDSLFDAFNKAKHDTTRINLYLDIGNVYMYKHNDSAMYYYNKALVLADKSITGQSTTSDQTISVFYLLKAYSLRLIGIVHSDQSKNNIAIEYFLKALKIFEEQSTSPYKTTTTVGRKGVSACYNNIGLVYSNQSRYEKAIENYSKALKISEESGDKSGMSACYTNIGIIHSDQGNYDKAIEYYFKALRIKEEINDKKGMSNCYNNIGNVNYFQGSYDKAIEYYLKSLKINEESGDKKGMSSCYTNIGSIYYFQSRLSLTKGNEEQAIRDYDKAIEYYLMSLQIKEEISDKKGMFDCYTNIGSVIYNQGSISSDPKFKAEKYDIVIEYFLKALKISEEIGDKNGTAIIYGNISAMHLAMADSTTKQDAVEKKSHLFAALEYGIKAYELAVEIKALPMQNDAAALLQKIYTMLGKYKEAIKYAETFISTQDSMFSEEKTQALAEMSTKYETEKKQFQIEKMENQKRLDDKTIEAQQAKNHMQQIIIISAIGGFLIVLVFSIIILRMFRQKQKANILLAEQNEEIRQQKEEISTQRDEIEAQRDTVIEQRDHIKEQKKEIEDSIQYAKRIQTAVLPTEKYAASILGDHFIIFRPKDVVSGDFYWAAKVNQRLIITVADCTGHGVPGAFMSMLGVSFLNEIVRKKELINAAMMLNNLRSSVIEALKQTGEEGTQKDGMDMSLVIINTDNKQCQWAGANNPLWIIRNTDLNNQVSSRDENTLLIEEHANDIIEVTKPDKMPVAVHIHMEEFTNHQIQLNTGDKLFLFSDGFPDQFGGPDGKKFLYKKFRKLIAETSALPMKEQGQQIEMYLDKWITCNSQKYEQVDDITVVGLKI
ncbi:MAG: tetratricopeptide repeat protein [Bacteroidota bacterium]